MVNLYGRCFTRAELLKRIGSIHQVGGITNVERTDGLERGSRVLDVCTGSGLEFSVLPDRGMDISRFTFQGIPLVWKSPNGDVAPSFYESGGYGWFRTFQGGLFTTCGLTHFGAPCEDEGEHLGIHGRIGNIPAFDVNTECAWDRDDYVLSIRGRVRQSTVFGENLVLSRIITTSLGSSEVCITDTVTNEGFVYTPHMVLYHFNLGFPLIDEDTILKIPAKNTIPRDDDALKGMKEWKNLLPPQKGFREQVFRHDTLDHEDEVELEVVNPTVNLRWNLKYRKSELPHLFQWKMMGEGTYVLGLEPANSSGMLGRASARSTNDLPMLSPGERRTYHLTVSVHRHGSEADERKEE